jgi:tetratricopeptide (TPR) repeat protein
MSETIPSIKLEGDNNVVIQSVNNSQITVQTVKWDDFVQKYTIEQRERIAELQKLLDRTEKLYSYERLELSQQINDLQQKLDSKEAQIKEIISSYKDKDLSDANTSPLYREALALFLNGKTDAVLELLSEAKMEEEERKMAQLRILKAQALQLEYRFEEAAVNYEKAVAIAPTYDNHFAAAYFYQYLNQFDEAEQHYEQALQKANSDTDKGTLFNNLGVLYQIQNKFSLSQKALDKALRIYRKLAETNLDEYLPDIARTLENLANLYNAKNDFDKAEKQYNEALQIRRKLVQINPIIFSPYLAILLNNLAVLYQYQNKFLESEQFYNEALKIKKQLALSNSALLETDLATIFSNLAGLYYIQHKFAKSEKAYIKALQLYRKLAQFNPATFYPQIATTLSNLGLLYKFQNKALKAEQYCIEALVMRRKLVEINPDTFMPNLANTLNNLGILYADQNEAIKAENAYDESLAIRRTLVQSNGKAFLPDLAETLNNLAVLYEMQHKFPQAENIYNETLEIYRKLSKTNSDRFLPLVARISSNISIFYQKSQPDYEKSIAFAKETLQCALPFTVTIPSIWDCIQTIIKVLTDWDIDAESFLNTIIAEMENPEGK